MLPEAKISSRYRFSAFLRDTLVFSDGFLRYGQYLCYPCCCHPDRIADPIVNAHENCIDDPILIVVNAHSQSRANYRGLAFLLDQIAFVRYHSNSICPISHRVQQMFWLLDSRQGWVEAGD